MKAKSALDCIVITADTVQRAIAETRKARDVAVECGFATEANELTESLELLAGILLGMQPING